MRLAVAGVTPLFNQSLSYLLRGEGHQVAAVGSLSGLRDDPRSSEAQLCLAEVPESEQVGALLDAVQSSKLPAVYVLTDDLALLPIQRLWKAGIRAFADKRAATRSLAASLARASTGSSVVLPPAVPTARHAGRDLEIATLVRYLTPREREVMSALIRGDGTATMVSKTGMAPETVRSHVRSVLTKMGAHSRVQAVAAVVGAGLARPDTGEWLNSGAEGAGARR